MIDQFTRWRCPKCDEDGFDSWNKGVFDGVDHGGDVPNLWILGDNCQRCSWAAVIMYTAPGAAPRLITGPLGPLAGAGQYSYEDDAMKRIARDPGVGALLEPAETRDADWSRGCLAAKAQLQ